MLPNCYLLVLWDTFGVQDVSQHRLEDQSHISACRLCMLHTNKTFKHELFSFKSTFLLAWAASEELTMEKEAKLAGPG